MKKFTDIREHIIKVGDKYRLVSKTTGKNLGTYDTKEGAEKREKQVQYFKHMDEDKNPCWTGYKMIGMKMKDGKEVPNCVPIKESEICEYCESDPCICDDSHGFVTEATYQGKTVKLNKPFRTSDGKGKFAVYAQNDKGNIVKVNFGDTTGLTIKTGNDVRRHSFRARHHCENPGPKWKAKYWSCKAWSRTTVGKGLGI